MPRTVRDLRFFALLAAAPALAACTFSNSPFEGDWAVTDGGVTLICDGGITVTPVVGPVVVIDGHSTLDVAIDGYTENFDISGGTANAEAKQIRLTDDAGFGDGWTLSLIGDALRLSGDTLFESATGTEETFDGGQVCGFSRWLAARHP